MLLGSGLGHMTGPEFGKKYFHIAKSGEGIRKPNFKLMS
jgi:hypothetical protein